MAQLEDIVTDSLNGSAGWAYMTRYLSFRQVRLTFASLTDQGIVSFGNFLMQMILARTLSPHEYGIFALIFGVMVLLNVCHWGVITYPLSVRGASSDVGTLRRLTTHSLLLTCLLAVPLCSTVAIVTWVLKVPRLTLWVAAAVLAWQLQETLRRGLMAHLRHHSAAWGDGVSYLGQGIVLIAIAAARPLSLPIVFAVIAITSLISSAIQAVQLGLRTPCLRETTGLIMEFWRIGNWALLGQFANTIVLQALPWTLAVLHGPEDVAFFQSAINVVGVGHPVMYGINNLVVPASLQVCKTGDEQNVWRAARTYGALGACILIPYYVVALVWSRGILGLLYGHASMYLGMKGALRILAAAYPFAYAFGVIGAFFNGVKRPSLLFRSELYGIGAVMVFGIPLALYYGIVGSCWAFLLVLLARFFAGSIFLKRLLRTDNAKRLSTRELSDTGSAVPALPSQSD